MADKRSQALERDDVELLITDVSDSFFLVPLHARERKYFVIKYRGAFLAFVRTAQGSRGAPPSWAVIMSLIARVVQSVFVTETGEEGRLQVYVDDPLLSVKGNRARRRLLAGRFIEVMIILGFRLAFDKAQFGQRVVWIGVEICINGLSVEATIPVEKLGALLEIIRSMQRCNVITLKDLRSLA